MSPGGLLPPLGPPSLFLSEAGSAPPDDIASVHKKRGKTERQKNCFLGAPLGLGRKGEVHSL